MRSSRPTNRRAQAEPSQNEHRIQLELLPLRGLFVVCGLDTESGLEPDELSGKNRARTRLFRTRQIYVLLLYIGLYFLVM